MGRKRIPVDQLKRYRRNTLSVDRLDIPKPSTKERAKWKQLEETCIGSVLLNERADNLGKKHRIKIAYRGKQKAPEGFPLGLKCPGNEDVRIVSYNAEAVLCWLYERWLSDYTPSMIYSGRKGFMTGFVLKMNSMLDIEQFLEHNMEMLEVGDDVE